MSLMKAIGRSSSPAKTAKLSNTDPTILMACIMSELSLEVYCCRMVMIPDDRGSEAGQASS